MKKFTLPNKLPVRILFLIAGMFLIAFGVALSTKSGLGVSPSAAIPFVLSKLTPISMGVYTTILNLIMILVQIVLLRKDYNPIQLLQLAVVFGFGYFTDLTLAIVAPLQIEGYLPKLLLCIISCLIMGLGLFLEVRANLITMSSEGAINAIVKKLGTDFGHTKMGLDCTLVAIGIIISLITLHSVVGVREGTVIAALLVGMTVRFYAKRLAFIDNWLNGSDEANAAEYASSGEAPFVITIEREYGTGGLAIAKKLAAELNIPLYDHLLIEQAAKASGYTVDEVVSTEEKLPHGLIYTMYNQGYASGHNISKQDEIFEAQSKIIKELAAKESCIILGRLGAYVLKNRPNTFNIFLASDRAFRANRIADYTKLPYEKAYELTKHEDRARANYCMNYTGTPWGLSKHYALSIDTSIYGIDGSAELIKEALNKRI